MEDRIDALGGTLEISSTPGRGTTLRASLPVRAGGAVAGGTSGELVHRGTRE
jgi:signal transduction histidine kinase